MDAGFVRRVPDAAGTTVPSINQIEVHPWLPNTQVRQYGAEHGIVTAAWSPLGRGALLEDPAVVAVAQRLGATPAQVVVRWHVDRGDVVLPKSVHPQRMRANLAALSVTLDDDARAALDALDRGEVGRQGSHPDTMTRM